MPRICVGPAYSLLLQRLATITIENLYIPMTATALASLGFMKNDLFCHLSEELLQEKSLSDPRTVRSAGVSLVKAYKMQSNIDAETRLVEILRMLGKHADTLSPKELVDIIKTCVKLSTISDDVRSCVSSFLHTAVHRSRNLDPFVYTQFIRSLRRLKAKKSIEKCMQNVPQVFSEATPNELCMFLLLIKDMKYSPEEMRKFLWYAISNHPELALLSPHEAEKVLLSIPVSKQSHDAMWRILSRLQRDIPKMHVKSVCKILRFLSISPALKKHPIIEELYSCLRSKKNRLPIRQILSCAFIVNRLDSSSNQEIIGIMHSSLLENFNKISWASYPVLLNYALKINENHEFKMKLYIAINNSLKFFHSVKSEKDKRFIPIEVKCDILRKTVELRYLLGVTNPIQNIAQCLNHLVNERLDVTSAYGLFFLCPLLGDQRCMISDQVTSLCHCIPNIVTEMSFIMCIKVIIAIDSPLSLDIAVWKPLAQRLKHFLEKNLTEQKFSLNQLNALVKAKVIYEAFPRSEWDDLLGENIALALEKRNPPPRVIAYTLRNVTDNALQLNRSLIRFINIMLKIPESVSVEASEITSFMYFASSYVSIESLRSVVRQLLTLCNTFSEFKLNEVNYILDVARRRDCERAEIPSNMISYLYGLKSIAITSGDLGILFSLLPHFEIDVNPIVFNLMTTALKSNDGWISEATPKDLVQVLTNLDGTMEIVNGPFIDAITARFERIIHVANGDEIVRIAFAILKVAVVHQRCGKPAFIHQAINAVSKKADSLCLRDIILLLKAVQISAHVFSSSFLMPFVCRMQTILRDDPQTSITQLNSALYGFYRVGLTKQDVFTDAWDFIHAHLDKEADPKSVSDWKLVDRLLHTMIITKIVHGKLAKLLVSMIPEFDENKVSFPTASRLYNSCVKLLRIDSSFVTPEILEKFKHLCLLNMFNSPMPMHVMQFVESASIRHAILNAKFDEESVSAILILAHRVNGSSHHIKTHCMNMIFKHLRAFDIDPQKAEWLSERGKVRLLVDGGYITTTHVLRFADTYAKHFKKVLPSINLQDVVESRADS